MHTRRRIFDNVGSVWCRLRRQRISSCRMVGNGGRWEEISTHLCLSADGACSGTSLNWSLGATRKKEGLFAAKRAGDGC